LIDAVVDEPLWSQTYDRRLTAANVVAIQSEIATSVAKALKVALSEDEQRRIGTTPPLNLAAVDGYFLGKQLLERRTRESLFAAVEYFKRVIELDAEFALGHSGLADAYMLLPEYVADINWQQIRVQSEAAARRAPELDPDLPEALTSMGWNRLIPYYDWEAAEALLRRALEVQSNNTNALHWLSHVLSWQGEYEEALELARRALEVDPPSSMMGRNLSYILTDDGDFEAAIDAAEENLRRHPDAIGQHGNLWHTYLRTGRAENAEEALVKWSEVTGRDPDVAREIGKAFVRFEETRQREALEPELIARMKFGVQDLGVVYAFLGNGEASHSSLERADGQRTGSPSLLSIKINPGYDFIRDAPRFQSLLEQVGLGG
jgi:tetratricopeptide (TPR) repeat protein